MKKHLKILLVLVIILLGISKIDVEAATAVKVKDVFIHNGVNAIIKEDNSLWIWGLNCCDSLGEDTWLIDERRAPKKLLDNVAQYKKSGCACYAVKKDGTLWSWGANNWAQLGDGTTKYRSKPVKVMSNVSKIYVDNMICMALKKDGSLWVWGIDPWGNSEMILGNGTRNKGSKKPIKIIDNVKSVEARGGNIAVIKKDNSLWMWGENSYGQIGNGTTKSQLRPVKVTGNVKKIYLEYENVAVIKKDGSLWMWGDNTYGQIGNGTTKKQLKPVKVMKGVKGISIGAGLGASIAAVKTDGSLWTWGSNKSGQLGNGTTDRSLTPKKIMTGVKEAWASEVYEEFEYEEDEEEPNSWMYALKTNGTLWTWGANRDHQLGYKTTSYQKKPVKMLSGVSKVYTAYGAYMALKKDDSLWSWGDNYSGLVGNGTTKVQHTPVKIAQNVAKVYLMDSVNAVIKNNHTLWMWGYNSAYEFADGTEKAKLRPTQVKPLKNHVITPAVKNVAYKGTAVKLNAKASGGGKLSYRSNNTKIATISSTGKITAKKYGKTTITVTAAARGGYVRTQENITIKVVPKKVTWDYVKSTSSGRIKFDWKKNSTVSGYECQVSLSSKFSKNKKYQTRQKNFSKDVKVPFEIKDFTSGKNYYVRVRAYKTVNGTKYYGSWSSVKKVKVK